MVGSVAVGRVQGLGSVHLLSYLVGRFGFCRKLALTAQSFGDVSNKKRSFGAGEYRHDVPPFPIKGDRRITGVVAIWIGACFSRCEGTMELHGRPTLSFAKEFEIHDLGALARAGDAGEENR